MAEDYIELLHRFNDVQFDMCDGNECFHTLQNLGERRGQDRRTREERRGEERRGEERRGEERRGEERRVYLFSICV